MNYYKITQDDGTFYFLGVDYEVNSDNAILMTEEEYNNTIAEIQAQAEAEAIETEQTKDERIAELEQENAALLYQVLTGEVFADV